VFQAEDGIRDFHVTGVQTCALPIWRHRRPAPRHQALMLLTGLLAGVEAGLNRVLRLDATALPRLQKLAGKVIAVHAQSPAFDLRSEERRVGKGGRGPVGRTDRLDSV